MAGGRATAAAIRMTPSWRVFDARRPASRRSSATATGASAVPTWTHFPHSMTTCRRLLCICLLQFAMSAACLAG